MSEQTKKVFIYEAPDQFGDGQVGCIVIVATDRKEADTILGEIKYSGDYIFETELDLTKIGVAYSNYSYSMKKR